MHPPRSRQGFTLIELLTVIAIIAVLMGLLFPAMNSVKEAAKRTQAKNDVTQIVTAVKAFYTEYGKYPDASATDKTIAPKGDNSPIIKALTAKDTTLNPRQIAFLELATVKDTTNPKSGVYNDQDYDPWGSQYGIAMDTNYDNQLTNPYSSNAGPTTLNTGVIAWSVGKDKAGGSGDKSGAAGADDVISWQ